MTIDLGEHRGFTIRERHRRCASPKEGMRQAWDEVQVLRGRRVIFRCDIQSQAIKWIDERIAAGLDTPA